MILIRYNVVVVIGHDSSEMVMSLLIILSCVLYVCVHRCCGPHPLVKFILVEIVVSIKIVHHPFQPSPLSSLPVTTSLIADCFYMQLFR